MTCNNSNLFRFILIGILTLADYSIFLTLSKNYNRKVGLVFLFNPISIIITGYHNQFDNVALAFGIWAILKMDSHAQMSNKIPPMLAFVLGISISIKHDLLLFLLWIFFDRKVKNRLQIIFIGVSIPVLLILPFLVLDKSSVVKYFFEYNSFNNAPLLKDILFTSGWAPGKVGIIFFIVALTILAYLNRNQTMAKKIPMFTLVLVAFSSSIANQYLAISAIGAAIFANAASLIFFTYSAIAFLFNGDELHLFESSRLSKMFNVLHARPYPLLILLIPTYTGATLFLKFLYSKRLSLFKHRTRRN